VDFFIKQGDTLPLLSVQLTDNNGEPVNLVNCEVKLVIYKLGEREMDITDVNNGIVMYHFTEDDTKVPGVYPAELKIYYTGNERRTIPTVGTIKIHVYKTLSEV